MEVGIKQEPPLEISFQEFDEPAESFVQENYPKRPRLCQDVDNFPYFPDVSENSISEMQRLLHRWGLGVLSDRFAQNLIDMNVLDYILDADIADLCRDLPLRYRIVLRQALKLLRHKRSDESTELNSGTYHKDSVIRQREPLLERQSTQDRHVTNIPLPSEQPTKEPSLVEPIREQQIPFHHSVFNPGESFRLSQDGFSSTSYDADESFNPSYDRLRQSTNGSPLVDALNGKVEELEHKWQMINEQNENLQDFLASRMFSMPLQSFSEVEGFIPADRLKRFSDSTPSDYVFVKLVMEDLWPEGFTGRSVTGRVSNNVAGRSGKLVMPDPVSQIPKTPLETYKVEYIRDRLLERRILLGDDRIKALNESKQANKLMARVIINCRRRTADSLGSF